MAIENRRATCDICGHSEEEKRFGVGWPGWVIVQGIGAVAPEEDEPISNKHMETYLCPAHREEHTDFITLMQTRNNAKLTKRVP